MGSGKPSAGCMTTYGSRVMAHVSGSALSMLAPVETTLMPCAGQQYRRSVEVSSRSEQNKLRREVQWLAHGRSGLTASGSNVCTHAGQCRPETR